MTRPTALPDDIAALTSLISRRVLFECIRYHPSKLSSSIHSRPSLFPLGTSIMAIFSWPSQAENPLRVEMEYLILVRLIHFQPLHQSQSFRVLGDRIVCSEDD